MINQREILSQIERFLTKTGMAPTAFGMAALKDRSFVFDMRKGKRSPSIRTVNKVDDFITSYFKKSGKQTRVRA